MDYLDPVKKRKHRIRLYIGYGLLTVTIAMATVILVYIGNGFYVDRATGVLIQNGQLYVNSAPDGATIYLNGREQRPKTAGRLVVPSGTYSITLKRDGYRDWIANNILLDGGIVERLDYARLLPTVITPTAQQTFATTPYSVSESMDRHFISLQFADHPLSIFIIDLTKPEATPKEIVLSKNLFSDPAKTGQLQLMEWADDAKHILIKNVIDGVPQDYILVNRESPEQSINLTTQTHLTAVDFSLRDRKYDQYYVYDLMGKTLSTLNLNDKVLNLKLTDVIAYKTYGNDTVLYVTNIGAAKGKIQVRLQNGDKTYLMRELAQSNSYLLAIGKLGSAPVMAIGVTSENKVTILRDPLTYLKANPKQYVPLATTVLQIHAPTEVSFSTDVTAVMARGGQNIAAHTFDEDRTSQYVLPLPISALPLQWVDGKHLSAVSGGNAYMFDYSGENVQKLVPSIDGLGTFFDNSYQSVFSFTADQGGKPFNVNRSLLRPKSN